LRGQVAGERGETSAAAIHTGEMPVITPRRILVCAASRYAVAAITVCRSPAGLSLPSLLILSPLRWPGAHTLACRQDKAFIIG
jgi:hypothetical protein